MTRISVKVESDHLEELTRPSRRLAGLSELIWNGLDAEADRIEVHVAENDLGGIDRITVEDNGHGMTHAQALEAFSHLGGSWKRLADKSQNKKRLLHGSKGQGRWRAFSLGDWVRWESVAEDESGRHETTITGTRAALTEFDVSDPVATENAIGTNVHVETVREEVIAPLLADDAVDRLVGEFAIYLEKYPDVEITYRGFQVRPEDLQSNRASYAIEVENSHGAIELTVIEWKREFPRGLLLCDENGMTLSEVLPGIQAPAFNFTAYIRWAGFRVHESELLWSEGHAELAPIIEAAKDQLRQHFRERAGELRSELIRAWKEEQVYPYQGAAASPTERVERELFDVVAVTASRAVNTGDRVGKKLSLRLLKQVIEQRPASMHRVLQEVLDLPADRLAELERLLERTTLSAIISAAKVVADRLDFLRGLEILLFEPENKRALLERTQLHRMLAEETWVFGDEYTLSVDDESLTSVLKKHIAMLGRDDLAADVDEEVLRADGSRGVVDLMFSQAIRLPLKHREHLVVELKRPSTKVGKTEIVQIEEYAFAVQADERFSKTDTTWTFWIVSNEFDSYAERRAQQQHLPSGVIHDGDGIRIWAKTWAEVIEDCNQRLKFVQSNLDYRSTRDHAVEYLRDTYRQFLPGLLGAEEGEAVGAGLATGP
ncbi:MAG TPA: ATP-binding protein [Gaiellaceae bacterium]